MPILACAWLACSPAPGETRPAEAALEPAPGSAQGEIVLDRRADGATLWGRLEPIVPNSDADRILIVRAEPPVAGVDGARALDARFAGDAILVLGADHVLRAHAQGSPEQPAHQQGAITEVDRAVEAPLAVAGRSVAYARGEMPFFEIARAELDTGGARAITQGMAPAWSPALSPDGREVVFVSSAQGSPRLHRVDAAGTVTPLPATARTPSSPRAPTLEGDRLTFDDEQGRTTIDLRTGQELR